jgi:hypothetical protein
MTLVCLVAAGLPAARAENETPAAVVNGVRLERWEAERALQTRVTSNRFHRSIPEDTKRRLRMETLDELVMNELKRQWLESQNLQLDLGPAEARWGKVRDRFATEEEYQNALAAEGIADGDYRRSFEREAAAEAADRHISESVPAATEAELRSYFEASRGHFTVPESRHVVHAFFFIPPADAAAAERAEREFAALLERVEGGESTLETEAEILKDSLPPRYRDMVGDVGFVHRGSLVPEIEQAVFEAEVGSPVGPLRTMYGLHVAEVLEVRPARAMPFEEVRDGVVSRLRRERTAAALERFEEGLRSAAVVERFGWADGG